MEKERQSLRFNHLNWEVYYLGEHVLLLEAPDEVSIEHIHASVRIIQELLGKEIDDLVPSYRSIALFFEGKKEEALLNILRSSTKTAFGKATDINRKAIEIPICYEWGLDLEELANHTGISVEEIINIHLSGTYRAIFIGFTPGFIYADGLDKRLACPRKASPRKRLAAGSIGIGGSQTGIYSLESPGGWNIIGQTPLSLFDGKKTPPMHIEPGTVFRFVPLSKKAFESWEN